MALLASGTLCKTDNSQNLNNVEVTFEMNNDFMSPREVAEALGVSSASVVRWVNDGTMAGQRFGKRIIRIRRSEVERLLSEGPADKVQ